MTQHMADSPPPTSALAGAIDSLGMQWRSSRLLRLATVLAICILAAEGLHQVGEAAKRLDERAAEINLSNQRLAADLKREPWSGRLDEANRHLQAARSLAWAAPDEALLQASLQDSLRTLATKAGLDVREVRVARLAVERSDGAATPQPGAAAPAVEPTTVARWRLLESDGLSIWRLRLVADFKKVSLVNFLTELSAQQPMLVMERLQVRTGRSPGTLEIELRALARIGQEQPSSSSARPMQLQGQQ